MEELGTWLRETRETKGISLADVEARTRIRQPFLEALEEGSYQLLPDEVCVRGFLRNYALYLGLDSEEVLSQYKRQMLSQRSRLRARGDGFRPIDAALERTDRPSSRAWIYVTLIVMILLGAAAAGVSYYYGYPLPELPRGWSLRRYWQGLFLPISPTPMAAATSAAGTPTAVATPAVLAVPSPSIAATSAVLPLPTPVILLPTATTPPTPIPVTASPQGIELKVRVIDRAWALITVDGNISFQGTLEAGEEREWRAERAIGFRCGNGGGVLVTVNGQELGALGERGQVVDQTWTVSEAQTTTATPPAP